MSTQKEKIGMGCIGDRTSQAVFGISTTAAATDAGTRNQRVRDYLEECGFFAREEKRGFSGAYGFLSGGPHPGIVDQEAARLGRNFALGSCHYALQKYSDWARQGHRAF